MAKTRMESEGKKRGRPTKPETYPSSVSIPSDELNSWKAWLAQHGEVLGYRSMPDFLRIAVREKQERDEERLLRLRALHEAKGKDDGNWREFPKKP